MQDDSHDAKKKHSSHGATSLSAGLDSVDGEIEQCAKEIQAREWREHGRRLGFGRCMEIARRSEPVPE